MIGLVAALFRTFGRRDVAVWLCVVGVSGAYFGSTSAIGDDLLIPLERQYPPLRLSAGRHDGACIVVLASGYAPRDGLPVTAALDDEGLRRIVEGVRPWRAIARARLIFSGGAPWGGVPAA